MPTYRRFKSLQGGQQYNRTTHGCWMFRDHYSGNSWKQFNDDEHFANTAESGQWEVRFFTLVPDMPLPAGIQ